MARHHFVNAALITLAVASSALLWRLRDEPGTSERDARKDKLLPSFRKEDVGELRVTRGGLTLELSRDAQSGDFRITRPWPERADTATINQLLTALDLASALRKADGNAPGASADDITLEVTLGNETWQIRLGAPAPSPAGARYTVVKRAGKPVAHYVVSAGVVAELDVELSKFREPRLLEYGRRELAKVTLSSGGGSLELSQRAHAAFFFTSGAQTELAAPDATERVLNALSRVATERFVEPAQASEALKNDPLTVIVESNVESAPAIKLTFAAGCYQAPELATVLREVAGKPARAGCLPSDVMSALRVGAEELRLDGAFASTPDAVEELSLQDGARKLELARKDKSWILRSAGNRELTLEAGNQRVSALLGARGQRPASEDLGALGLQPAAGRIVVQVTGSDEATHREESALLGQVRSDGSRCIERLLDHVRLCFERSAASAFDADASLLRSVEVLRFAPSELAELTLDGPQLHERVTRAPDGSYALVEPPGFRHDGSLVADAVQSFGTLQAVRWVAAEELPKHGFATPRLKATARLNSGVVHELTVGAATAGGAFARLASDPAVFVLGGVSLADLETPLVDRTLCPFSRADLSRVELQQGARRLVLSKKDDAWQGDRDRLPASRAAELGDALTALRAEQALHLGAARPAEGLDKPRIVITFSPEKGNPVRLLLGARSSLGDEPIVFARLEGVDATFALLSRTVDDLTSF